MLSVLLGYSADEMLLTPGAVTLPTRRSSAGRELRDADPVPAASMFRECEPHGRSPFAQTRRNPHSQPSACRLPPLLQDTPRELGVWVLRTGGPFLQVQYTVSGQTG